MTQTATQTQTTQTQTSVPNPSNPDTGMVFDSQPVTSPLTVNPQIPANATQTAPAPQPDSGMVFDSQPTATAIVVPDLTATTTLPPSQSASAQPVTSLQHGLSVLNGDTDPEGSWYPELGSMMSGAIKSASNGLAGILDFINKPSNPQPQPIDPESIKATMEFYRRIHPSATQADAQAFMQKSIESGRQPFSSTVQDVSNWLHSAGQPEGFWENVGGIGEQALEWIGLDGLTKLASAPAAAAGAAAAYGASGTVQHIAQAGKVAQVLADNRKLAGMLSIGLKASRDAILSGTQQYAHSDDNPASATEAGLIAGALSGVLHGVPALVQAGMSKIRAATDTAAVQDALQGTIRVILSKVAAENNVPVPTAPSLRAAAGEVGNSVKGQASKMYRALDQAIGGTRFQTFDEQLSQVRDELRNSANIDHDAHGEILERYNALEDAKHAADQMAIENGVDPATLKEANQKWKTGSALLDFQKDVQMAAQGLRPELHAGLKAGQVAAPETLSTGTLATRANRMYNNGRLAQALNPQNADDLLRAVEVAAQRERQVAANSKRLNSILKTAAHGAAYGVGLGGGGAVAYEAVKHLTQ